MLSRIIYNTKIDKMRCSGLTAFRSRLTAILLNRITECTRVRRKRSQIVVMQSGS